MRKKPIVRSIGMVVMALLVLTSCEQKAEHMEDHDDPYALEIDSSLAVLLKPTNQEIVSNISTLNVQPGPRLFTMEVAGRITYDAKRQTSLASRVSGRIERLHVKYNYQPIEKGQLIMEIYSPELAAAQRELLVILASQGKEFLKNAKQRLLLLGMTATQIDRLISTKEVSYRIPVFSNSSGYLIDNLLNNTPSSASSSMDETQDLMSNSPVMLREGQYIKAGQSLFTIYRNGDLLAEFSIPPSFMQAVKTGTSLLIQPSDAGSMFKGEIRLIEPLLKNGERFSIARVYLSNTDLRPGQLVTAHIPIFVKDGWWVPQKAVWQSGIESIVFKREKGVFVPRTVKSGVMLNGQVQLLEDISDWEIASNAYYLVDSESFIRPQNTTE